MSERRRILLIEDNQDDAELAMRALKLNQVPSDIVKASDGVEALAVLFGDSPDSVVNTSRPPAVTLLDLKLPKVDGLEVLKRIREDPRTALMPVVVLTSSTQEEDRLAVYRLRANSYVRKPIVFERFIETVRQLGVYWLELNEPPPA